MDKQNAVYQRLRQELLDCVPVERRVAVALQLDEEQFNNTLSFKDMREMIRQAKLQQLQDV